MGNFSCSGPCFDDYFRLDSELKSLGETTAHALTKETLCTESNDSSIILIQACWRGFIQKKHYRFLKRITNSSSFFPQLDLLETLSNVPVSGKSQHSFTYASGTIYQGHWLGGFRHGPGKATWPDGSTYNGKWSYGYPYGNGLFSHSDGEKFNGTWVNPYSTTRQGPNAKSHNGYGKI